MGNNTIHSSVVMGNNVEVGNNIIIGKNVSIGNNVVIEDGVAIGDNTIIENSVELGYSNLTRKKKYYKESSTNIGKDCILRSGCIIYHSSSIGNRSWIGNYTIIRENTIIGNDTTIGAHVMCEGYTTIGNGVQIYSFCELGGNQIIEDNVFIGPGTITSNNRKPVIGVPTNFRWNDGTQEVIDKGPTIKKGAKIGISATLLADTIIGEDSLVSAGAVVTKDVAPFSTVKGIPAK